MRQRITANSRIPSKVTAIVVATGTKKGAWLLCMPFATFLVTFYWQSAGSRQHYQMSTTRKIKLNCSESLPETQKTTSSTASVRERETESVRKSERKRVE